MKEKLSKCCGAEIQDKLIHTCSVDINGFGGCGCCLFQPTCSKCGRHAEDSKNVETSLWCDGGEKCRCTCHQTDYKLPKDFKALSSKDLGTWEETDCEDRIREFQKDFDSCVEPEERGDVMFNLVSDIRDEFAAEIEKAREDERIKVLAIIRKAGDKEIARSLTLYKKTLSEEIEKMNTNYFIKSTEDIHEEIAVVEKDKILSLINKKEEK